MMWDTADLQVAKPWWQKPLVIVSTAGWHGNESRWRNSSAGRVLRTFKSLLSHLLNRVSLGLVHLLCVCVCVCTCECVCVCVHVSVCVCVCACIFCVCQCMYMCIIDVCVSAYICTFVLACSCVCVCLSAYAVHAHVHDCAYIPICT